MDWYNYSGDLSNIQSLKVIKPVLEEKEAIEIFNLFREAKQLHPSITSWQRAWNKIAERQLLAKQNVKSYAKYVLQIFAESGFLLSNFLRVNQKTLARILGSF